MNKLTDFEVREIAQKWSAQYSGNNMERAIVSAIRHAEVLLSERNVGARYGRIPEDELEVMVNDRSKMVNKKTWRGMWAGFDRMMREFGSLFD